MLLLNCIHRCEAGTRLTKPCAQPSNFSKPLNLGMCNMPGTIMKGSIHKSTVLRASEPPDDHPQNQKKNQISDEIHDPPFAGRRPRCELQPRQDLHVHHHRAMVAELRTSSRKWTPSTCSNSKIQKQTVHSIPASPRPDEADGNFMVQNVLLGTPWRYRHDQKKATHEDSHSGYIRGPLADQSTRPNVERSIWDGSAKNKKHPTKKKHVMMRQAHNHQHALGRSENLLVCEELVPVPHLLPARVTPLLPRVSPSPSRPPSPVQR